MNPHPAPSSAPSTVSHGTPSPSPNHTLRNSLFIVAGLLCCAWLLGQLAPVLTPFIAGAIVAYILNPFVLRLSRLRFGRRCVPRAVCSALAIVMLIIALIGLGLIVLPVLRTEIALLQLRLPGLLETAHSVWIPWIRQHLGVNLTLNGDIIKEWFSSLTASDDVVNHAITALKSGSTAVLGFVGTSALALVLVVYLLMDWPEIVGRLKRLVPRRWEKQLGCITSDCDRVLGQYLRGQLAVMLVLCVYYSVALWLAGFDVALPVGVLTGLLIVIPYLGFTIGLLLALAAAVLQFSGFNGLIWVAVIYGFGQILEGFFLTPRWVGASLGLHPAAVIFALLSFGQLLGFVGVLLALPLAAVAVVVGKALLAQYITSDWYRRPR